MTGVPGAGGPPPKRSDQRRRNNKPAPGAEASQAPGAPDVVAPEPDPKWHPVARAWFEALVASGQAVFYEPSDYATAVVIAESMSRELHPQQVVTKDGAVVEVSSPPKAASIAAWLKGATALMATEGDRRRLRLELLRPDGGEEVPGDVSWIDDARRRLREPG